MNFCITYPLNTYDISIFPEELIIFFCQIRISTHCLPLFLNLWFLESAVSPIVFLLNSYDEALTPNVIIYLEIRPPEKVKLDEVLRVGPKSDKAPVLMRWTPELTLSCSCVLSPSLSLSGFLSPSTSTQKKGHVKTQKKGSYPQDGKRGFTGKLTGRSFDLGLLASTAVRR